MSRYLTLVVRLADNADARLVFEQVERINGVALSASSWSHVMDARDTLTAEVARLMGELERSRQECERMREDAGGCGAVSVAERPVCLCRKGD